MLDDSCRNAHCSCPSRHRSEDNRIGADRAAPAKSHRTQNLGTHADSGPIFNDRALAEVILEVGNAGTQSHLMEDSHIFANVRRAKNSSNRMRQYQTTTNAEAGWHFNAEQLKIHQADKFVQRSQPVPVQCIGQTQQKNRHETGTKDVPGPQSAPRMTGQFTQVRPVALQQVIEMGGWHVCHPLAPRCHI